MMRSSSLRIGRQKGAVLILVAVILLSLLGFAALAIDVGSMVVVKNELQNAADAGALAGASQLYYRSTDPAVLDDPSKAGKVSPGANVAAELAAKKNSSVNIPVEVTLSGDTGNGADSDVQRGHWSRWERKFYPLDTLEPIDVTNVSKDDLDHMDGQGGNPAFVNAVRVVANRKDTPAPAFFSRIFDFTGFVMAEEAVAYVEFAGSLLATDVDQPIAICKQSITDGTGNVTCNIGRMINSGDNNGNTNPDDSNTGGWTNFEQDNETCLAANANEMADLVCKEGNPVTLIMGLPLTTTGGMQQTTFDKMRDCWLNNTNDGTKAWKITLPVVDCEGNNIGNCPTLVGAVTVNVVWVTAGGEGQVEPPSSMESPDADDPGKAWTYNSDQCSVFKNLVQKPALKIDEAMAILLSTQGYEEYGNASRWIGESKYSEEMARWDCFAKHYQLKNTDDLPAPLDKKSLYFLPECDFVEPKGVTGGPNYGVLARIPVLVK